MHETQRLAIKTRRQTPTYLLALTTVLFCLPILALAQFNSHARVDEFDAWLFAYYGRQLLEGATLYADVWDNKPPGIFWINALGLWLGGGSLIGVWIVCGLAVVATTGLFFSISRRLYGNSTAWIATVLAALYLNVRHYHVGCNRPATFLVLTELACVALYFGAIMGSRRWRGTMLLAGMCGGLGLWLKQSVLAASIAVGAHLIFLLLTRKVSWRDAASRAALFAAGWCLAVGVAVVAILATSDAGWAWDAVAGFNVKYFQPGAGASFTPAFLWMDEHLRAMGLPLILAAATLVQPALRRWVGHASDAEPPDPVGRRPDGLLAMLWVWMIVAVYLAAIGPHQRGPYMAVALPPLVMLAGHGVYKLLRSGRRISHTAPAYHVVVGVLWMIFMLYWPVWMQVDMAGRQYYHQFLAPPDEYALARLAAIRRHSAPSDTMFIFGYAPDIYWQANRRPAIRYIGTEKAEQLGRHGRIMLDEIVALLMEAEPKIILYNQNGFGFASRTREWKIAEFADWLTDHYEQAPGGKAPDVWVRRVECGWKRGSGLLTGESRDK